MNEEFLNDPEFQKLIRLYLGDLNKSLPDVKGYIKSGDFDKLYQFAHNLKGSGGGYSFNDFSEMGMDMMDCIKKMNIVQFSKIFEQYEQSLGEKLIQFNS